MSGGLPPLDPRSVSRFVAASGFEVAEAGGGGHDRLVAGGEGAVVGRGEEPPGAGEQADGQPRQDGDRPRHVDAGDPQHLVGDHPAGRAEQREQHRQPAAHRTASSRARL